MFSGARFVNCLVYLEYSEYLVCFLCCVGVYCTGCFGLVGAKCNAQVRLAFALGLGLGPGSSLGPGELSFCYFSGVDNRGADCGCCLLDLHPSLSNPEDNRTGRRGGGLE